MMRFRWPAIATLAALVTQCRPIVGGRARLADIAIEYGVVTPPGAGTRADAYLLIRNTGRSTVTLTAASSPDADSVWITNPYGNLPIRELTIVAGSNIELAPGGAHLGIAGIRRSLASGDTLALALQFGSRGPVTLRAPIALVDTAQTAKNGVAWWCASLADHDRLELSYFWASVLLALFPVGIFTTIAVLVARAIYRQNRNRQPEPAVGRER